MKILKKLIIFIGNDIYTHLLDLEKPLTLLLQEGIAKIKTRFPLRMGLSGAVLETRKILFSNKIEDEQKFNDDVDNLLKLKPLKNLAVMEVSAWEINPKEGSDTDLISIGVVQFANKKMSSSFPFITKSDIVSPPSFILNYIGLP